MIVLWVVSCEDVSVVWKVSCEGVGVGKTTVAVGMATDEVT